MSDLAQWIAYQRRAAVFGTSEETVLALLDVAEQAATMEDVIRYGDISPSPISRKRFLDALARLAEVKP